jgi:hypothetical protein
MLISAKQDEKHGFQREMHGAMEVERMFKQM